MPGFGWVFTSLSQKPIKNFLMKVKYSLFIVFFFFVTGVKSQNIPALERIEPAFWWVGMKNPKLQLLVHGNKIANRDINFSYPGVTLIKVNKVENPNYLFLDLEISASAAPGSFPILFTKKGVKPLKYNYEIKQRDLSSKGKQGVTNKDFVY